MEAKRKLIIDIYIDEVFTSIAASFEVKHTVNIAKKYRVSDKMLNKYGSIVESVVRTIASFPELSVEELHQSNQSYTVYILVKSEHVSIDVIFRLHDHPRYNTVPKEATDPTDMKSKTIVKDIRMNGQAVDGIMGLIDAVYAMCEGLAEGNIDPLLEIDYED